MEKYVSYKQAFELKKLGFNQPCNHYYQQGNTLECQKEVVNSNYTFNFNDKFSSMISAPTLSEVQSWLRDLGLICWAEPTHKESPDGSLKYISNICDVRGEEPLYNRTVYVLDDTYEDALEESIEYAMDLLKEEMKK